LRRAGRIATVVMLGYALLLAVVLGVAIRELAADAVTAAGAR
jgi:hypothetical protein